MSGREGRVSASSSSAHRANSREKPPSLSDCERLNVLVCGSDGSLKSSISELILQHTHRRSESVRTDVDLHGGLINVLELPALFNTELSEEEVMRQTLRCVSRCHPGVHAFLLIIPDAPLNNEDTAEMEEIQKIFSSRINKHIIILIMQNSEHQTAELDEETQVVIQRFGGRHHYFSPKTQVSTLMENIEKMLEENRGGVYSTETFLEVQMEKRMKYEEMKINSLESHLQTQGIKRLTRRIPDRPNAADGQQTGVRLSSRRIVLLGEQGAGKSSSGNTILGHKEFRSQMSMNAVTCQCSVAQVAVSGRSVSVVDTPGLFYTQTSPEELMKEIAKSVYISSPGPHAFLIVFPVNMRFTKHEQQIAKMIQKMFGEEVWKYSIILFTHGDLLDGLFVEKLIKENCRLMSMVQQCGGRYHVFNNRDEDNREQVEDLQQKIDSMIQQNGGGHYTNQMYEDTLRLEREKSDADKSIGFMQVFYENQQYFYFAAVAAGIAVGGFAGGVVVIAIFSAAADSFTLLGAIVVGTIAGGAIGGGAASGTLKGAVAGAVAGAAVVGAPAGGAAGEAIASQSNSKSLAAFIGGGLGGAAVGGAVVGGVASRSYAGAVCGAAFGAINGAAVIGNMFGVGAGRFIGEVVAGRLISGALKGVLRGTTAGAVAGVVAGGVIGGVTAGAAGGAVVGGATSRSLTGALDGAVAGAAFGAAAGTVAGAAAGVGVAVEVAGAVGEAVVGAAIGAAVAGVTVGAVSGAGSKFSQTACNL